MHTKKKVTFIFLCWVFQCSIKICLAGSPLPSFISTKHGCMFTFHHVHTDSPAHFKVPQIDRAGGRAWHLWSGFRIITISHTLYVSPLQKGSSYPDSVFFFRLPSCLLQSVQVPCLGAGLYGLLAGSESSPYHPAKGVLSSTAEASAGRTQAAHLSTACEQTRCNWGLTYWWDVKMASEYLFALQPSAVWLKNQD